MNEKIIITGKKGKALTVLIVALAIIGLAPLVHQLFFSHYGLIDGQLPAYMIFTGVIVFIAGLLYKLAYRSVSITVTDKRVYGTAAWGKRVDLPLDKISAVATSFGHGIAVATSSGSIRFKAITNNAEVHAAISKLLMERQEKAPATSEQKSTVAATQSNADELKKFKELLDSGVITQEEFDAKKKQLLGL